MNSDPVENSGENLCGICEFACRLLTEILANTCFPYCEGGRTGAGFSSARESVGHRRHGVPARPRTLHGAARPSPGSPCRRGPRTGFPRYAVARGTGSAPGGDPGRFLSRTTFRDGRPGARHGNQPSRTGRSFAPAQRDRPGQAIPEGAPRPCRVRRAFASCARQDRTVPAPRMSPRPCRTLPVERSVGTASGRGPGGQVEGHAGRCRVTGPGPAASAAGCGARTRLDRCVGFARSDAQARRSARRPRRFFAPEPSTAPEASGAPRAGRDAADLPGPQHLTPPPLTRRNHPIQQDFGAAWRQAPKSSLDSAPVAA